MVFQREIEGKEQASAEVISSEPGGAERRQRLSVVAKGEEAVLVLSEGGARMRSWPVHVVKLNIDASSGIITLEAGGETQTWTCPDESSRRDLSRAVTAALAADSSRALDGEALGALLEDAAPDDADAEQWVKRLAERLAKLDALNVGGMLAAATEGGGAKLANRLEAGVSAGTALCSRLARYEGITKGAAGATQGGGAKLAHMLEAGVSAGTALCSRLARYEGITKGAAVATQARGGAAAADANSRKLLNELDEIYNWLDSPSLADLDTLSQVSLSSAVGRARALSACEAIRFALRAEEKQPPHWRRLAAVRERLRRLNKAKDQLSGALARHLNNTLIHLGNEAATGSAVTGSIAPGSVAPGSNAAGSNVTGETRAARHQRELLPYAPCMRWLKDMDEKAYNALVKVYVNGWSRVYEREVRAACDAAKVQLANAPPEKADECLDQVLSLVENLCNIEQDFCTQFFSLDIDVKSDGSDGDRSEKSEGAGSGNSNSGNGTSRNSRSAGAESRRFMAELFPAAETELVALVGHIERNDVYNDGNSDDGNHGKAISGNGNSGKDNNGKGNSGNNNSGDGNSGNNNSGNNNSGNGNVGNGNSGNNNRGNFNSGDGNIGDGSLNSGNGNTGKGNTGDANSGNGNTGNGNRGDGNTGNSNIGNGNRGYSNNGDGNIGDSNYGDGNRGNGNIGHGNIGNGNTGNLNIGDGNSGNGNTGNHNSGDGNTGDCNIGNGNTGNGDCRRTGPESRRFMRALLPAAETQLVGLVTHIERSYTYGAMRALACASRRVLGEGGEGRWARALTAAVAVAAKRGADRVVADIIAAFPDAVKQAARKPKCGVLSFISEFEELSRSCELIFSVGTRRADLERWYLTLASAMLQQIQTAEHPRTPKALLQTENYHRLHAVLSSLRVPALESARRECKSRYAESLRLYVTQYFGRPLEKLTLFFEGVAEAVAAGAREEEVCYRAAFSKHELRRILAMYPPHEVRKSLHRLYRTVEKHVSEESGLLQVVWRAMQEEFLAQYVALQARIAACYPGAGLAMPLSTQDILDAFSDIAREH